MSSYAGAVIATVPGVGFDGTVDTIESAESIFSDFMSATQPPDDPSVIRFSLKNGDTEEIRLQRVIGSYTCVEFGQGFVPENEEDAIWRYLACWHATWLSQASIMMMDGKLAEQIDGVLVAKANAKPFTVKEVQQIYDSVNPSRDPAGFNFTSVDDLHTLLFLNIGGEDLKRFVYRLVNLRLQERFPCLFTYEYYRGHVSFIERTKYAHSFEFLRDSLGSRYTPFFRSSIDRILRPHISACERNNIRFQLQAFLDATPFLTREEVCVLESAL